MRQLNVLYFSKNKTLDKTIELVKSMAWIAKSQPEIKNTAVNILDEFGITSGRNKAQVALSLARWVGQNIKYVYDPWGTEILQTPQVTLEYGYGDCDDMSLLLAALLMSVGIETRFRVVGRRHPEHIFVEALVNGAWVGYDPAVTFKDPHPKNLITFRLSGYRKLFKR